MIYLISTVIVAAIIIVISIFPLPKNPEIFPGFDKIFKKLTKGKVRKGQAAEGYGEFGLSATNPIPTHTNFGSYKYLNNLKTIKGKIVLYDRLCSMHVPNIPYVVDKYSVWSRDTEPINIYICPYYSRNSDKAPKGFWIEKNHIVFKGLKTLAGIVEFVFILFVNLVITTIIMLFFKQLNAFNLVLISTINTTWIYFILRPILDYICYSNN